MPRCSRLQGSPKPCCDYRLVTCLPPANRPVLNHTCRVAVLDGGLPAWRAAGGEVDSSPVDEAALHAPAQALHSPPAATK